MSDPQTEARLPVPAGDAAMAPGAAEDEARPGWLVGRTIGRWRQALWEIATSARLPFLGSDNPDLPADQAERLRAQLHDCLEARGGEVLARARMANVATAYLALSPTGRARFFALLAQEFAIDRNALEQVIDAYHGAAEGAERLRAERDLRRQLYSPAMRLLTKFNALPGGLRLLIDMRADLLAVKNDDPALRALDHDFRHLLATWFDIGFLSRQRLTWDSPASLLERVVEYEAVHEIRSWTELRHRLDGDCRCYAFFHPSLPREPLIFVQVALTEGLAGKIEPLLDEHMPGLDPQDADTAIFYSITSTLDGLRGISFGNFLIKQVVDDLAHDLPNLRQFATLSPLPGFRRWLASQPSRTVLTRAEWATLNGAAPNPAGLAEAALEPGWLVEPTNERVLEAPLIRAAARYLVERDEDGLPIDPVARFHLGNGARIERLNWAADGSARRREQSCGIMVNYLYHRAEIETNHEAFASRRMVTVSTQVNDLLPSKAQELVKISRRGGALGRMMRR